MTNNPSIEQLKKLWLTDDLDEEDYEDNLKTINEFEESLRENEDFAGWQDHDITKMIIQQVKDSYKEFAEILMTKRDLTDRERDSLYAKQDACTFLLSLVNKNVKLSIRRLEGEILKILKVEE